MLPQTAGFEMFDWMAKHGGGIRRPASAVQPEPDEPEPAIAQPPRETAKPQVTLHDLKWVNDSGAFGSASRISVHTELPESLKHITRVQFDLFAVNDQGKREAVDSAVGHIANGIAEAVFVLPHNPGKDDLSESERSFICVVKHRDSEPLESSRLIAKVTQRLEIEVEDASAWQKSDFVLCLQDSSGAALVSLNPKDGEEKDGRLTFRFEKLDFQKAYSLEIRGGDGKVLQTIFKSKKHGEWDPGETGSDGKGKS